MAVLPGERMLYFDVKTKTWKNLPVASPPIEATRCFCAVSVCDKLIVTAQDSLGYCIYRYDTEANVWERLPHSGNDISKLCVTDEYMYLVNVNHHCRACQRYSFAKRRWQAFTSTVRKKSKGLQLRNISGAVVLNSKVYVLERNQHEYIEFSKPAVLYCFDPHKNIWEIKATTSSHQLGSILTVVKSKLYVAGGEDVSFDISTRRPCGTKPASAEMYNEETNTWSVVEKKFIPANNLNAVEIEGRVYFIINKFPIDSGIRTADGPLNSAVLNEWENLRKIDNNAALGYMVMNRGSGESQASLTDLSS